MTTELETLRQAVADAEAQLVAAQAARTREIARKRRGHWPWTFGAALLLPCALGIFLAGKARSEGRPSSPVPYTIPVSPDLQTCNDRVDNAKTSLDRCERGRTSLLNAPTSTKPPCIVGDTPCP